MHKLTLDDTDPLPKFGDFGGWTTVHKEDVRTPMSNRQIQAHPINREPENKETPVRGKPHFFVNAKGQMSYRPPEPAEPRKVIINVEVSAAFTDGLQSLQDMIVSYFIRHHQRDISTMIEGDGK